MKTIVLSGYYGFNNAGDEALLAAIAGTLRKLDPELNLVVLSASPTQTEKQHGIKAVSRVNPAALVRTLRRADLLISGGGSLLQDVTSWRSILYYLGIVTLALLMGTPVMFYAQGIGPIRRKWTRRLTKVIANRVQLITVRDEDSSRELRVLGVTRPPVLVTADPVLGMPGLGDDTRQPLASGPAAVSPTVPASRPEAGDQAAGRPADEIRTGQTVHGTRNTDLNPGGQTPVKAAKGRIGFALRNWKDLSDFKTAVAEAADYFSQQGWEIVFIPFHFPDDLAAAQEVTLKMHAPGPVIVEQNSVWPVLQEIRQLDLLIGMRLHSLIFAAAQGVPLLGIAYDPKVTGFLEQLGEKPVGLVEDLTAERLIQGVNQLIQRLPIARAELQLKSSFLGELARENARLALKLLNGNLAWPSDTALGTAPAAKETPAPTAAPPTAITAASPEPAAPPASTPATITRSTAITPAAASTATPASTATTTTSPEAAAPPADAPPFFGEPSAVDRQSKATVLGARIDRLNMQQTLQKIIEFINSKEARPRQVITLNAEIIYQAQQQPELLQLINQADLVTPDGAGVVWASRHLGQPVPERVTGIDLIQALGPVAEIKGYRLFLLGAAPGIAAKAGQKLQEFYPKLTVAGTYHGYFPHDSAEEQAVLQMIRQAQPDLLLVALGAPRQEFWIRRHLAAGNLTVPVSIGVGGSLDVIAGQVKRAPVWMRRCQLEWLARLVQEPRRWRRMLALPKFVLKVLIKG